MNAGSSCRRWATDITGASSRAMREALIEGQRDPAAIADLVHWRMRPKIPALMEALTGRFSEHHRFMVRLFLDRIDAHSADIARLDARIEAAMVPFAAARELLISIPGISRITAEVFIAETGADMSVPDRGASGVVVRALARIQRVCGPGQVHEDTARESVPQGHVGDRCTVGRA